MPRNSEIEHFSSNVSWIDVLCPGLILWLIVVYRERLNGVTRTVQHFRTKCFYGKNNTWRNTRDYLVKRVSVIINIHCHSIWQSPIFNNKWNKKVNLQYTYGPSPPRVCLHMSNDTPWQEASTWFSIVHRRRTSWPFPRREISTRLSYVHKINK